ncbi:MAG TPA: N-acetylglucosaminyldiphospho-UDP N-acetyl-beta-D-mannosaminyltransferase, partial [Parvularcula sp.]|nr:N-acetylglucosaminyldiphospho-UDP N-acetyl-beta-D-mannosaminyltransferase [Parvularcula sp.]
MTAAAEKAEMGAPGSARIAPLRTGDDFDRDVWSVLGVPIDRLNTAEALAAIERAARDGARLSFVTPNVNFLVRATQDEAERRRIIDADLSLVDGAPLVLIGRLLGMKALTRCAGSDIFEALRKRASFGGRGLRVFFFGGRDGAAEAAAAALKAERRGLQPVGAINPGFGDVEAMSAPAIINAINEAAPDFLVVALGASKGQEWIDANQDRLTAPVIAHLGAVVDFTAGTIARAPV